MSLPSWTPPAPALPPGYLAEAGAPLLSDSVGMAERLRSANDWTPAQLLTQLGQMFGYGICSAQALQAWQADFTVIAYPDCEGRSLALARDEQGQPRLVMADPFDGGAEDWALQRCREAGLATPLAICLAAPASLREWLTQQEGSLRAIDDGPAAQGWAEDGEGAAAHITLAGIREQGSEVVRLVDATLYDAHKLKASDIHLECDGSGLHVLYRIDGVLVPVTTAPGQVMARQVISRIKVMAELDIAESRIPQDGRLRVRINGGELDLRVSIMPSIHGEDAVLRLLDRACLSWQDGAPSLDRLGMPAPAIRAIRTLAARAHGMLLVSGPTGSGKTTTLYAALSEIHTGRDKLITIEDPVEYRLSRVLQIPVNEKKGLGFARGLRSILRHDPDKIMVGEIRDGETAQIAVQAALTGHLVMSTVHANSAFDVLGRFIHMGLDAYSLASAMNGIVAQRLVRMLCPHCAVAAVPSQAVLDGAGLTSAQVAGWQCMAARGCAHCRGSGYLGRRCAAEVLVLDDGLRDLIAARAPASALRQHAGDMMPLRQVLLAWVREGKTTLEEVARVAG